MKIPTRLGYVLERDQELDGAVKLAISNFEPWIKHSNLPFFPEYTDHGIDHIEGVLKTTSALIRDEAWEVITPSDAAVLVISVLLHDCAMHLSEDGFVSLFEPQRRAQHASRFLDKPWHVLWEDFLGEATRFEGRKLTRLFGDDQPVRRPPMEPLKMDTRDRLLIGEFLRRHHHRLAHEIALFGVPTKGRNALALDSFSNSKDYIPKLSGIVARSHGEDVRALLPYLENEFDLRQYKGVHGVFLMTLLRIGDYLQVEAERAPAQILSVKGLISPISQGEWNAHAAITDVRLTHPDPEAVFVDAMPKDVHSFLRIKDWLQGIQRELDSCWAVLGEVYGRYGSLNHLALVLRRVRSSLDDVQAFAQKVDYLPRKAAFKAADADLLKLLIEPLYGNRPEIGLRELIQNAVDAVRELSQVLYDIPELKENLTLAKQDDDVVVSIEKTSEKEAWVIISDKGIGMTPEIVTEYFLAAGASFRRSESWRKAFEENGESKILRAGRFGVGALASFLLGPEIEVSTRHVEEREGLFFVASVDRDSIELRKINRPVGTTIKIRIPTSLAEKLERPQTQLYDSGYEGVDRPDREIDWDWYCLRQPVVRRLTSNNRLKQRFQVPCPDDKTPSSWHRISHPDYQAIYWTFAEAPRLVCNGIRVKGAPNSWMESPKLRLPSIAVFDPNGRLPLNLQRNGLTTESYPFQDQLVLDIAHDFVAYALVQGPIAAPSDWRFDESIAALAYPGSARIPYISPGMLKTSTDWYVTADGFGYLDESILHARRFSSVLLVEAATDKALGTKFEIPNIGAALLHRSVSNFTTLDAIVREIAELGVNSRPPSPYYYYHGGKTLSRLKRTGVRFLVSEMAISRAKQKGKAPKWLLSKMRYEEKCGDWHLITIGTCPAPNFRFSDFIKERGETMSSFTVIAELYIDENAAPATRSPVADAWIKFIGAKEIPFNMTSRTSQLANSYTALASYVNGHQNAGQP